MWAVHINSAYFNWFHMGIVFGHFALVFSEKWQIWDICLEWTMRIEHMLWKYTNDFRGISAWPWNCIIATFPWHIKSNNTYPHSNHYNNNPNNHIAPTINNGWDLPFSAFYALVKSRSASFHTQLSLSYWNLYRSHTFVLRRINVCLFYGYFVVDFVQSRFIYFLFSGWR